MLEQAEPSLDCLLRKACVGRFLRANTDIYCDLVLIECKPGTECCIYLMVQKW